MGFWSGLGKVLGAGAGIAAIPFTGGASAAMLPAILGAGGAVAGGIGSALGGGGAASGAASQAQASNRGTKFAGQMDMARLLMDRDKTFWEQQMAGANTGFNMQLAREQEGRVGRGAAWQDLRSAQRLLSPHNAPKVSPYQGAPRQATGAERAGADAMTAEVLGRLQGGNPISIPSLPTPVRGEYNIDMGLLDPGKGEKTSGWLSPILTGAGAALTGIQQQTKPRVVMNNSVGPGYNFFGYDPWAPD